VAERLFGAKLVRPSDNRPENELIVEHDHGDGAKPRSWVYDLSRRTRFLKIVDDPRHPVVHFVQCDRGRERVPERSQGGDHAVARATWPVVARQVILPGIFPYYVTGALTATGGSWNASIVAEVASWSNTKLEAAGLGSYIAKATEAGDMPRVVLGSSSCRSSSLLSTGCCGGVSTCSPSGSCVSSEGGFPNGDTEQRKGDRRRGAGERFGVCHVFEKGSGQALPVLEDIALTLHDYEIVSLLGRSGSGKSTLLRSCRSDQADTRSSLD